MKELARQPWSWVLCETSSGRLVLSVNCGTVASYEVSLELTSEEARDYGRTGSPSVDALAKQVASDPRRFGARNVRLKGEDVVAAPLAWHHRSRGASLAADSFEVGSPGVLTVGTDDP